MNLLHLHDEVLRVKGHGFPKLLTRNAARVEQAEKLAWSLGGNG
jgi:hypothetical protein